MNQEVFDSMLSKKELTCIHYTIIYKYQLQLYKLYNTTLHRGHTKYWLLSKTELLCVTNIYVHCTYVQHLCIYIHNIMYVCMYVQCTSVTAV